ncbi:MAG: flagellin [bacterium]
MGLRINQSISALSTIRNLRNVQRALIQNAERLSTGIRINRASDDPAGLVISENLRAQTDGISQTIRSTENELNRFRTSEGRLGEVQVQLRNIRTQTLSALNTGGSGPEAREAAQASIRSSVESIARSIAGVGGDDLGVSTEDLDAIVQSLENIDVTAAGGANAALQAVDAAISGVSDFRGRLGAIQENELESSIRSLSVERENLTASESAIRDTDFAQAAVAFVRSQILLRVGTAISTQANSSSESALRLLTGAAAGGGGGGRRLLSIA